MTPFEKPEEFYTKEEVNMLVQAAVAEAREMDDILMRKHNRNATIISAIIIVITIITQITFLSPYGYQVKGRETEMR